MSWFGTEQPLIRPALVPAVPMLGGTAMSLAPEHVPSIPVSGARPTGRGRGASRNALLDHIRDRWGELPMSRTAGRHTPPARFATDHGPGAETTRATGREPGRPGVVIIASPSDLIAQLVATSLVYAHVPTCQLDPRELDAVELRWHGDTVSVNGRPLKGVFWRAARNTGQGDDSKTLDPRTAASWLAAASFPSMRAVNAYDPVAWSRGAGRSVWMDRLCECGVPVQTPPERHATSSSTSLVACGSVVSGPDSSCVAAAAQALETSGVRLAVITSQSDGCVSDVDTQPRVTDSLIARRAAARIADYLAA